MTTIIYAFFNYIWVLGIILAIIGMLIAQRNAEAAGGFRRSMAARSVQAFLNLGGACLCIWLAGISGPGTMRTFWLAIVIMFIFLAFTPVKPRRK